MTSRGVRVLVSAERVLLGSPGERIDDGAVLVDGATIAAVGPRSEVERVAGPDAPRVHGTTLLPGLIDAHVHLAFDPRMGLEESVAGRADTDLALAMSGRARRLLDAGVTTARDLGDRGFLGLRVRDAIARGAITGPRMLVAGTPLTPPGGHCWFLGGEVDPVDERALRLAVAERSAAGVDVIKVMASGGQGTPTGAAMWERQFDAAALGVIVDEARRHGLPVAAHAHGSDSIADAVGAGVASVEHCSWLNGPGVDDQRDEVADAMAAAGIAASIGGPADWRPFADRVGAERARSLFGRMRWLGDRGVPLLVGTDAGLVPFEQFPASLAHWGQWGFAPAELIEIATSGAARQLGLASTTGRLAPGLDADLLLVDGRPDEDIGDLTAVELVVARGRPARPATP